MKSSKLFALTSLLLALTACGSADRNLASALDEGSSNSGIIGGQDVAASDAITKTTVGLVLMMDEGQAICTGSIVSENVVLTAAHCVHGINGAAVVFGTDLEKSAQSKKFARVTKVFIHPGYVPGADKDSHDIALVKFAGKLPAGYTKATLLDNAGLLKKGMAITLAGYGASEEVNGELAGSPVLRKATVPLLDPNFSQTEISFSSTDGSGACHGDSGGPAFATIKGQKVVVGVTSRTTDKTGGCHKDSVYTNVAAYKTLIDQMATKLQAAAQ